MAKTRNAVTITKELKGELKKYSHELIKKMATEVSEELDKTATYTFKQFYATYTPRVYKRNYDNFIDYDGFLQSVHEKYVDSSNRKVMRGGVKLSSRGMANYYRVSPDYVFNEVLMGYHGNISMLPNYHGYVPPVMSPNPLEIMLNRRDYLTKHTEIFSDKVIFSMDNNYSTITVK